MVYIKDIVYFKKLLFPEVEIDSGMYTTELRRDKVNIFHYTSREIIV